jgi:hypothetical protein
MAVRRTMPAMVRPFPLLSMLALAACKSGPNLPACSAESLLTVTPRALDAVGGLVPLGSLNPPGHTFPTDHVYFYGVQGAPPSAVVAPGHAWIVGVQTHDSPTPPPAYSDYTLTLAPCDAVRLVFMHVSRLAPSLAARVGEGGHCSEYDTGGRHYRNCDQDTDLEVAAGDALGEADGTLDLGAQDTRSAELSWVAPGRIRDEQRHVVCPLDLFEPAARDSLYARLGSYDGTRLRTVEPRCGQLAQDVAGTAQGVWYRRGAADSPEDPHLALVHDNVDPRVPVFSVGTSVPGLGPGVFRFTPASTGVVDRDFRDVVPVGTYCWNLASFYDSLGLGRVVIAFSSAGSILLSYDAGTACGTGPFAVGAGAVAFDR